MPTRFFPRRTAWIFTLLMLTEVLNMAAAEHIVKGGGLSVTLSDRGEITRIVHEKSGRAWDVAGSLGIAGCTTSGTMEVFEAQRDSRSQVTFTRHLVDPANGRACQVKESFTHALGAVDWSVEITGEGEPWSSSIETRLAWKDAPSLRFWTAWADPEGKKGWNDPLVTRPFRDVSLWYGQPSYEAMPYIGFHFNYHKIFSVPIATIMDEKADAGVSLVLSPDDAMLDMKLDTTQDGGIVFSRQHHRVQPGRTVKFTAHLFAHEADWRPGLGWMAERYKNYFEPPLPYAHQVAGTGAYSWYEGELDAARFHQMAFRVNWKASFDFPFMGMFLPPIPEDQEWINFRDKPTSIKQMAEYSQRMHDVGFHVLNYFNVTEFGTALRFPLPPPKITDEQEMWKDSGSFIQQKVADGILYASNGTSPFYSWFRCVAMDPGGPDYQKFLLAQADAHIEQLPASTGICIDRTDWLRFYNPLRDDGQSWMWNRPVASLFLSWNEIMEKLGDHFHKAGKLIYINNAMARVDLMRDVDGMFDEFTYIGSHLNKCAFMCIKKPLIGWIEPRQDEFKSSPDAFMQQNIYMGCYPMAPFPGNDHSNLPDPQVEQLFIDYGPLMDAMRGKQWVLAPHVVSVPGGEALANLFEVPGGFVVPVIHAKAARVRVVLRGMSKLVKADGFDVDALHPGVKEAVKINVERKGEEMILDVPVVRGCAMLRLKQVWLVPDVSYFFGASEVQAHTAIVGATMTCEHQVVSGGCVESSAQDVAAGSTALVALAAHNVINLDVYKDFQLVSSRQDTIIRIPLPAPRILCASATFDKSTEVKLECTATEAAIHYTLDGAEPVEQSPRYVGPVTVNKSQTIKARAFLKGTEPSSVAELQLFSRLPRPPKPKVFISDLEPTKSTVGWGDHAKTDLSIQRRPLTLCGEIFDKGMGTSAVSELAYPMKPAYKRFVAVVGIDDEMKKYDEASVVFQVWMDDRMLCESPVMRANDVWYLDVELPADGKLVRLIATDAGDGINCDHADWADAGFVM